MFSFMTNVIRVRSESRPHSLLLRGVSPRRAVFPDRRASCPEAALLSIGRRGHDPGHTNEGDLSPAEAFGKRAVILEGKGGMVG